MHEVVLTISVGQLRAARGLIGWSQTDLAGAAKVGRATIADFETGKRDPYPRTIEQLQRALEAAGVEFIPENGGGAGVRLRAVSGNIQQRIEEQEAKIAGIPEHSEPSPAAGMAAMDKALAENDLVDMKNARSKRRSTRRK